MQGPLRGSFGISSVAVVDDIIIVVIAVVIIIDIIVIIIVIVIEVLHDVSITLVRGHCIRRAKGQYSGVTTLFFSHNDTI